MRTIALSVILTGAYISACGSDEPSPPITTTILICDQDNDLNCVGGDNSEHVNNTGDGSADNHAGNQDDGGAGGSSSNSIDCSIEPPGTLCAPGKSCAPDGRCAVYDWWLLCGTGPECPDLDCQAAICVQERCMRWFAEDGEHCLNEFGTCSGGTCTPISPHP